MFIVEIKNSLAKVLKEMGVADVDIALEHPAEMEHGDYSTNIALKIKGRDAKFCVSTGLGIADLIVKKWQEVGLPDCVEKIEVAGPGFLNIWLNFDAYSKQLTAVLKDREDYGSASASAPPNRQASARQRKTMVIDYSAPNIAKPFGIGHLRSTNIGQAIYNMYQFCGWKVIGDNHLGDWGTQFGRLICQIEIKNQKSKIKNKELTIGDLERLYVDFHKDLENDPSLEEKARGWFKKLEEGDKEATEIWQACVDISLKEFDRVYDLLGVKIDFAYGESFYLDKMDAVLKDCKKKGILKESQGAKVVEIPGMEVPAMLVKSDGATTYFLRDLAAVKYRIKEWHPDLIVYEVGADQSLHFQQLFNVCEQLEYGNKEMFVHIAHGLIRWPTGKFSTRKGMTIHLEEVLNEAIKRANKLTVETQNFASLQERIKINRAIGIGAIKYNDLKQNPRTDIIFDWDQILTLSGNSGPYLQYTYARTQSVLAKSLDRINTNTVETQNFASLQREEISLLRTLYKFPEIVENAAKEFSPNLLCNFLFDLAQKFNLFYDKQRIIGSDNENFRLTLTKAVGQVLKNGLTLLGIEALEKM